jgi:archaemetzincin
LKLKIQVQILPIGEVDMEILDVLYDRLKMNFSSLELLKQVPLIETAYREKREQYLSNDFLQEVKWQATVNGDKYLLGVTEVDLYTHGLNFVFGQAELPGKAAIISLSRLKHQKTKIFQNRMLKEAIHELGHTLGLRHCKDVKCVMHFSKSLKDTDIKGESYCKKCNVLLSKIQSG